MKRKLLPIFPAAALLLGSAVPASVSAFPVAHTVIAQIQTQTPGQTLTVQGSTQYPEVVVKVSSPGGTVLFFDIAAATNGQFSTSFTLPSNAAVGTYTIAAGMDSDIATSSFFVQAASSSSPTTPTTPTVPSDPPIIPDLPGLPQVPPTVPTLPSLPQVPPTDPATPQPQAPVTSSPAPAVPSSSAPTSPSVPAAVPALTDADPATGGTFEIGVPAGLLSTNAGTSSGRAAVKAALDHDGLKAFVDRSFSAVSEADRNKPKVAVVEVQGQADEVEIGLIVDTFNALTQKEATAALQVKSSLGTITIPAASASAQARKLGLEANAPVTVKIFKADSQAAQNATDQLAQNGSRSVAVPVDFRIEARSGERTVELNAFDSYIGHTLSIPASASSADMKHLAGVMLDTQNDVYYPMPTFFEKKADGSIESTILRKGNSVYTVVESDKHFTDIGGSYAEDTIETLANKLIIDGYADGSFLPNRDVSRAEFSALLVRALGLVPSGTPTSAFADVKSGDWYAASVSTAVQSGLVRGYEDGTFRPDRSVSRQEMVQMIYNAMKLGGYEPPASPAQQTDLLASFPDGGSVPAWAREASAAVVREGIVAGTPDGRFSPDSKADRAQSATLLHRMLQKLGFSN